VRRLAVAWMLALGVLATVPAATAAQSRADSLLTARVTAAVRAASDLPADSISVSARGGIVRLTGSLLCDDCGGNSTPGGTSTIQQSLSAVVHAVPGVERVDFDLTYRRPQ
jgi:osmotically-inducible protein OsmY